MRWVPAVLLGALAVTATYFAFRELRQRAEKDEVEQAFDRYVAKWGKAYSAEERKSRLAAFRINHAYITSENAKNHSYTLGFNEYADWTPDEFATTHFGMRRPEKLWGSLPHLGTHVYSGAALPSSVDWTKKGAVTKVKNQAQCGSCWAFSSTGSLEGAWELATGKLVSISEQQFVDCAGGKYGNEGCNGGLMDHAFEYAEKNALCTEASYPYTAKTGKTCKVSNCEVGIPAKGVKGFKDVQSEDLNALAEAVAQQPVSIAIEADQRAFQLYKSGVLTGSCGSKLDHGVLIVGFGTWTDGTDYWKVKNSWGPDWGMDGYVLIEKGKSKAGECGVKMQPSYPVVDGSAPPGPAPGPSPPGPSPPPPGPSPGPTPSGGHYGRPPCLDDETHLVISGANAGYCAPKCSELYDDSCPTDVPENTIAIPMCSVKDTKGNYYCDLACIADDTCPSGATCYKQGQHLLGICVYPEDKNHVSKGIMATNHPKAAPTAPKEIVV